MSEQCWCKCHAPEPDGNGFCDKCGYQTLDEKETEQNYDI
jgi:ribosomal protein L40E